MTSREHALHSTHRGYWRRITPASPSPATMPSRAHIICTATMSGNENSAVHKWRISERGAGDRIGGDAGRIVVGSTRDQTGSQPAEESPKPKEPEPVFVAFRLAASTHQRVIAIVKNAEYSSLNHASPAAEKVADPWDPCQHLNRQSLAIPVSAAQLRLPFWRSIFVA